MKWGIKTKSTPFGTVEPVVKPFGTPNKSNSHQETSSPMTSPPRGESYIMKGGSKNE